MERISEALFGLIMVLTVTSSLSIATGDHSSIRTMLIGALGCNLAWGIIDAGMYLMARLNEQGRSILLARAVREAADDAAAHRAIEEALPPLLASSLGPEQLELLRLRLRQLPEPPARPGLTGRDAYGALAVCLVVFLTTLPVVVPFAFMGDPRFALRISNAIAISMLFLCGYGFGHYSGLPPWPTGLSMVVVGGVLVGIAVMLGG
jgi:VIT1/CCC1 family predicted Fe2+/Mn2+ transporter